METINDIVREMREFADTDSQSIGRDVLRRRIHKFADRIKKAHEFELAVEKAKAAGKGYAAGKQSVTDCNQHETVDLESRCIYGEAKDAEPVGNAAKMREVIDGIKRIANSALTALSIGNDTSSFLWDIIRRCEAAPLRPARNCDLYSHDEALRIWSSLPESKENGCFDEWLYAEAKGEAK